MKFKSLFPSDDAIQAIARTKQVEADAANTLGYGRRGLTTRSRPVPQR
jgi:hypothetical protein